MSLSGTVYLELIPAGGQLVLPPVGQGEGGLAVKGHGDFKPRLPGLIAPGHWYCPAAVSMVSSAQGDGAGRGWGRMTAFL